MTIDTDHLRRTARLLSSHSRNILTPAGVDAVIAACDHIDAQEAEIESLRRVLHDLVSGAGAEMAPGWICNSYHPKLVKALDKARAALSGEPT